MSWADNPLLALDCESTGVDPFPDRIVEGAAVLIDPDGTARRPWSAIVNPGVEIPADASEVHGITTGHAREKGEQPSAALSTVATIIWEHIDAHAGQAAVVMFNARFDWPLLLAEAARHHVDEFPVMAPVLDPYLLDRMCDRYRRGKRQLTLVADHYGVSLDGAAHGALVDAKAAGRVAHQIVARYPDLAERNLPDLYLHQAHGHEQDRQRFEDYLRRNVDPEAHVTPGWPVPVEPEVRS